MPSDKMKDGNEADNKRLDPGSEVSYELMIYLILAAIPSRGLILSFDLLQDLSGLLIDKIVVIDV